MFVKRFTLVNAKQVSPKGLTQSQSSQLLEENFSHFQVVGFKWLASAFKLLNNNEQSLLAKLQLQLLLREGPIENTPTPIQQIN